MNGIDLSFANVPTPETSRFWRDSGDGIRLAWAQAALAEYPSIEVRGVTTGGRVILRLKEPLNASERGPLLLEAEEALKRMEPGLTVWLEPKGDMNALRQLRGIEVKR